MDHVSDELFLRFEVFLRVHAPVPGAVIADTYAMPHLSAQVRVFNTNVVAVVTQSFGQLVGILFTAKKFNLKTKATFCLALVYDLRSYQRAG